MSAATESKETVVFSTTAEKGGELKTIFEVAYEVAKLLSQKNERIDRIEVRVPIGNETEHRVIGGGAEYEDMEDLTEEIISLVKALPGCLAKAVRHGERPEITISKFLES